MDEKKLRALTAELTKALQAKANLNQFSRILTKLTVKTALNPEVINLLLRHEKCSKI